MADLTTIEAPAERAVRLREVTEESHPLRGLLVQDSVPAGSLDIVYDAEGVQIEDTAALFKAAREAALEVAEVTR